MIETFFRYNFVGNFKENKFVRNYFNDIIEIWGPKLEELHTYTTPLQKKVICMEGQFLICCWDLSDNPGLVRVPIKKKC